MTPEVSQATTRLEVNQMEPFGFLMAALFVLWAVCVFLLERELPR